MSSIFVRYLRPYHPQDGIVEKLQSLDTHGVHKLATTPESADIILFVKLSGHGPFFTVLFNELYRKYPQKTSLFCSGDLPLYFLPGLYPSLEESYYSPQWALPFHYIHGPTNDFFDDQRISAPTKWLYSFVGNSNTHSIRTRVLQLSSPCAYLNDTFGARDRINSLNEPEKQQAAQLAYRKQYSDALYDAKFILCPRGFGTSTFRIFEAMRCGRVPVIISDEWQPPAGPDWERCSVRIAQKDIEKIPSILEDLSSEAATMGTAARSNWLQWFSPEVSFHHLVETLLQIDRSHPVKSIGIKYFWRSLGLSLRPASVKGFIKEVVLRKSRW